MNYWVFVDTTVEALVKRVEEHTAKGWRCQGGVSVTSDTSRAFGAYLYCQAMVHSG